MNGLNLEGFTTQDIKTETITEDQLEEMRALTDSYNSLFSKVARKYRAMGLNEINLSEDDLKGYILQEYTFLKRPVFLVDGQIFIGNSKKTVAALQELLNR